VAHIHHLLWVAKDASSSKFFVSCGRSFACSQDRKKPAAEVGRV
jgi:hypothetical protein